MFGSWPSFSTFKTHIFFLWKFRNKGDRKKIQNGHMTVPNIEFPAALMLDATGYAWSVDTVDFLNDCCLLHRMDLKAQRILNQQTHCHLFISDWKNIVIPGVTLSFKQLKSFITLYVASRVNKHRSDVAGELNITSCTYYNKYFFSGGLQSP